MGKIYYIMGKSASGKDSIYKEIKKRLLFLHTILPYTTRPIRENETEGVEYHFVDDERLQQMQKEGQIIELRSYHTKCGIWNYFTANDEQIDLEKYDHLTIGSLESYIKMCSYFGTESIVPIYIEVEDGLRLSRAIDRERKQKSPKYAELCRRFLSDSEDFSEEKLKQAGIIRRFQNIDFETCVAEICDYINQK